MTINSRTAALKAATSQEQGDESRERILDAFRRWGYLQADLDPLGRLRPAPTAVLDAAGERGSFARRFYCGAIGAEFMHIPDPEQAALDTRAARTGTAACRLRASSGASRRFRGASRTSCMPVTRGRSAFLSRAQPRSFR